MIPCSYSGRTESTYLTCNLVGVYQYKNATEIAKENSVVYGQDVITKCQIQNRFSKFRFGDTSLRELSRPERLLDVILNVVKEFDWMQCA